MKNAVLERHEMEANRFSSITMLLTIFFLTTVFLLDLVGIFKVPIRTMTIAYIVSLSWFTVATTLLTTTVGTYLTTLNWGVVDQNYLTLRDVMVRASAPRGIQILALSLIFTSLARRTNRMLQNTVAADEQQSIADSTKSQGASIQEVRDGVDRINRVMAELISVVSD